MKKLFLLGIAFFLIFAMVGGIHCAALELAVDDVVDELEFASLEELLVAHKAVREGTASAELTALAESVKFAELDEFYFPTGIPEEYKLYKISINYLAVNAVYLTESDLVSKEAIDRAIAQQKEFDFCFYRENLENPMEDILEQLDATEKDLVDGIYLFNSPYSVYWASDRAVLHLYMPLSLSDVKEKDKVNFVSVDAVDIETGERWPYSPPVLYLRWWQKLPAWLQWILRFLCFGWIWMK